MPVERKPIFRTEVIGRRLAALGPSDRDGEAAAVFRRWAALLRSPSAATLTESELLPDFPTQVFYGVLGYTGPSSADERHTLSRERRVEVRGEYADAGLGHFGIGEERVVVAVEGKGPRDPLDRPFGGRALSARSWVTSSSNRSPSSRRSSASWPPASSRWARRRVASGRAPSTRRGSSPASSSSAPWRRCSRAASRPCGAVFERRRTRRRPFNRSTTRGSTTSTP